MDEKIQQMMAAIDLLRSAYRKAQRKRDAIGLRACERIMDAVIALISNL